MLLKGRMEKQNQVNRGLFMKEKIMKNATYGK